MSKFSSMCLEVEKPVRMFVRHPATGAVLGGDENPAWIDLYSADSDIARQHEVERLRRQLEQKSRDPLSPEAIEAANTDYYVSLMAGWNLVGLDGQKIDVPFTPDDAGQALSSPGLRWLRDQVAGFVNDRANFVRPLSKK